MHLSFRICLYCVLAAAIGSGFVYFCSPQQPTTTKQVRHRHQKTVAQTLGFIPVENEMCKAKRAIGAGAVFLFVACLATVAAVSGSGGH